MLHRSSEHNKMAALEYVNTQEDKLCTHSNAVLVGLPLAVRYLSFTSVCESSYTTKVHRCPTYFVRSVQKFSGKENQDNNAKNMKRPNGVRFSLTCTAVGFRYAVVLKTLGKAYP